MDINIVNSAQAEVGTGLIGDHHARSGKSKRQVTIIQAEHLDTVSAILGQEVTPQQTRRNLVVGGINLYALRHAQFQVGEAVLQGTGICDPCNRMEQNLGHGALNAMRGHGGITAKVISSGKISIGDPVTFLSNSDGFTLKSDMH